MLTKHSFPSPGINFSSSPVCVAWSRVAVGLQRLLPCLCCWSLAVYTPSVGLQSCASGGYQQLWVGLILSR